MGIRPAEGASLRLIDRFPIPADVVAPDDCAYPLARNLALLEVALGADVALRWLLAGQRENYSITLRDLTINREG